MENTLVIGLQMSIVLADAHIDFVIGCACCLIVFGPILIVVLENIQLAKMSPEERASLKCGPINPLMVCPHCQSKGMVRTKDIVQKKGISGGKATAAIVTGGLSVLATGLSRKEGATQAHCCNCQNTWTF